jgi:predicted AAA+ superfamily ATPase
MNKTSIIPRPKDVAAINKLMKIFPVTAILGPRQCGKTVLAQMIGSDHRFDLENPRDLAKLENPQLMLESLSGTIVIDEIQRKADLFPLIRYMVDAHPQQRYLSLGSASENLIRQSSESLAGRIGYHYLHGFSLWDVGSGRWRDLWIKGGYPRAFLSANIEECFLWLDNYIATFLERDLPQLGIRIAANTLRKFWIMISHYHGQIVNYSEIGRSFGISDMTVRTYIGILEKTFMVRLAQPWYVNVKKRLVKQPKLYIRDPGIFHALQSVASLEQLSGNPRLGASWEGFAVESAARSIGLKDDGAYFYATHNGAELDLFWQHNGKNWGVECKYADAPRPTKSMRAVIGDLDLSHLWVIYPGKDSFAIDKNITVTPLSQIPQEWQYC